MLPTSPGFRRCLLLVACAAWITACGDAVDTDNLGAEPLPAPEVPDATGDEPGDATDSTPDVAPQPDHDVADDPGDGLILEDPDATELGPDDPAPDVTDPAPDAVEPDPDVADPQPDVVDPQPDVVDPDPDVPPADPDVVPSLDDFPEAFYDTQRFAGTARGINGQNIGVIIETPRRSDGERSPVVILSPGFQLENSDFADQANFLARYGLIVVVPTWNNNAFRPRSHSDLADDVSSLISWVLAEDARAGSSLNGLVDRSRVAAGGHSRGGKQSILAATRDERILATFNLDPVDSNPPLGGGISVTPELMDQLTIPSVFLGTGKGGQSTIPLSPPCAPEADNYDAYFQNAAGPSWRLLIPNAGHNDFAARCRGGGFNAACAACAGGDEPLWNARYAVRAMVAFYRMALLDDESLRGWLDGADARGLRPWVEVATRNL